MQEESPNLTEASQVRLTKEQQEILKAHNDERKKFGVVPLQWWPQLAQWAQEWAQKLANEGKLEHRPNQGKDNPLKPGEPIGENLYWFSSLPTGENAVQKAVQEWINEKQWYHYDKDDGKGCQNLPPGCTADASKDQYCGHFTQVIWKSMPTRWVGCGKATGKEGGVYVVCNYWPAGNIKGEKPY